MCCLLLLWRNPVKKIMLAHGNGGKENRELIQQTIFAYLKNEWLEQAEDATAIGQGDFVMTTDSYTVSPIFFPGGDIGKLAVCGTCNDLAMMGAKPRFLSLSFIIEEGFEFASLEKILASMAAELAKNGAHVVTGDTKVVPRGSCDGIFINTTGIGESYMAGLSSRALAEGDVIIVSGTIGEHGAAIFAGREGISLEGSLESDCRSLWPLVEILISNNINIRALRDATRGGLSSVLNEWALASGVCIDIQEALLPVREEVRGLCELVGFEPYDLANEGTFVAAVLAEDANKTVALLHEAGASDAAIIGSVGGSHPGRVILHSPWGTRRFLEMPSGELLPRIC